MKPYLVDVPVKINIWIRPECQKLQWDVIRKARPSILFIQSDGGRNQSEWDAILKNRKMIDESIDWECKVYRLYEDTNLGLYAMGYKRNQLIWSKVDRCIFLEDDQIPSISYFNFCEELLEKYKTDLRIECICGMNTVGISEDVQSDYFFSKQGSIWGFATWKDRACSWSDDVFNYFNDSYAMKLLKKNTRKDKDVWKRISGYSENKTYGNHVPGSEFWIDFDIYAQNRLQIIPKYNMIKNIGCTENSEHSTQYLYLPKSTKKLFNSETYELTQPINHPQFVIADNYYMKKRDWLLGRNHRLLILFRKFESRFYRLKYGGLREALKFKKKKVEK